MIKSTVKRVLRTEEIKKILSENEELKTDIKHLRERIDGRLNEIDKFLLNDKEYISLEYLNMGKKPHILVCGFFGARNLGDELMLQAILKYFEKKKTKVTILLSDNYDFDASVYAPHDVIHYPKCSSDILALSKAFDIVIWAGGAHLDDYGYAFNGRMTNISYSLNAISKAVIKNGGKVIVLGVSSNKELNNAKYVKDLQFIIENAKYFSVRDTNSLKTLEKAGINVGKVEIIDDIALFGLDNVQMSQNKNNFTIGLVLIVTNDSHKMLGEYIDTIIDHFKIQKKAKVLLIPFYDYKNNDKTGYEAIINNYVTNKNDVEICDYVYDMEDLAQLFTNCDLIISMRYHATLIAVNMGIKTISLDYSKKHRHYSNKNKYIKEKYDNDLILCDYGGKKNEFLHAIDETINRKVDSKKEQLIEIKKRIATVFDNNLGNLK